MAHNSRLFFHPLGSVVFPFIASRHGKFCKIKIKFNTYFPITLKGNTCFMKADLHNLSLILRMLLKSVALVQRVIRVVVV